MSQPPGPVPGNSEQDDPRTVPRVESQTVPQVPRSDQQPAQPGQQSPQPSQQPPQYGQQPTQYGQAIQYGPSWQPGYGYPRRRNKLAWGVFGGGLFVVGMVITLVLVLNRGPDMDTPEGVAEAVADAFNDHDYDELVTLSCPEDRDGMKTIVSVLNDYGPQFAATARVGKVETDGDHALAELTVTFTQVPEDADFEVGDKEDMSLSLTREDGENGKAAEWCVSNFTG